MTFSYGLLTDVGFPVILGDGFSHSWLRCGVSVKVSLYGDIDERIESAMKNKLKVLRAERDWSEAGLAERLGVSRQHKCARNWKIRSQPTLNIQDFTHLPITYRRNLSVRPRDRWQTNISVFDEHIPGVHKEHPNISLTKRSQLKCRDTPRGCPFFSLWSPVGMGRANSQLAHQAIINETSCHLSSCTPITTWHSERQRRISHGG